MNKWLNWKG